MTSSINTHLEFKEETKKDREKTILLFLDLFP